MSETRTTSRMPYGAWVAIVLVGGGMLIQAASWIPKPATKTSAIPKEPMVAHNNSKSGLDELESMIETLRSENAELKNQIELASNGLTSLKSEFDDVQSAYRMLDMSIEDLGGGMDWKTVAGDVEDDAFTLKKRLDSLEGSVTSVDQSISDASDQADVVDDAVDNVSAELHTQKLLLKD